MSALRLTLDQPWLEADLGRSRQILSFAPYRSGFATGNKILWREVRNSDLTEGFDAGSWLVEAVRQREGDGADQAVAMMTSRRIDAFCHSRCGQAEAVATVGLGNAERIGHRRAATGPGYGTINIAAALDAGLTQAAMIEAITIIAQARTAAILDAGLRLPSGLATGTGTDCIAMIADPGAVNYTGLHTSLGEALGRACYEAVSQGAKDWLEEQILHPQP